MWIQIVNNEKQILICLTYRQTYSKGAIPQTTGKKLHNSYDKAVGSSIPNLVLVGDFNGDASTDSKGTENLDEFVSLNNVYHHIFEPTRVEQGGSATRSDLVLTNLPVLISGAGMGGSMRMTIFGNLW